MWRHAPAQLVEALLYKPEGRGFDFWLGNWILQCPWVDSASIRNGYREYLPWDKGRANSLTTFICRLSGNLGTWICVGIALPLRMWEISLSLRQLHIWEAAVGIECTEGCMGPSGGRDGVISLYPPGLGSKLVCDLSFVTSELFRTALWICFLCCSLREGKQILKQKVCHRM
jgi:hypothetical protein